MNQQAPIQHRKIENRNAEEHQIEPASHLLFPLKALLQFDHNISFDIDIAQKRRETREELFVYATTKSTEGESFVLAERRLLDTTLKGCFLSSFRISARANLTQSELLESSRT